MKHYGQKRVPGWIEDDTGQWHRKTIVFQVHNVKRVLLATGEMTRSGVRTVLGDENYFQTKFCKFPLFSWGDHVWCNFYRDRMRIIAPITAGEAAEMAAAALPADTPMPPPPPPPGLLPAYGQEFAAMEDVAEPSSSSSSAPVAPAAEPARPIPVSGGDVFFPEVVTGEGQKARGILA